MKRASYVGSFLFSILLLLQGCMCFDSCWGPSPSLLFSQGSSDCRLEDEEENASVSFVEGVLTFSGRIATSTPCQHLIPSLKVCGKNILIRIDAVSQPGACPLCLGMVDYDGAISGLSPGEYHVRLVHEDRTVVELQITIG